MTRVLIVDDKEQDLYLLDVLLQKTGHTTMTARNGVDALTQARRQPPDLIVSDILMPDMDGFTLCREWRADPMLRSIPFVFYTATYTDPRDETFALQLGADKFITKPTDPAALVESIDDVLSGTHSRQNQDNSGCNEAYFKSYSDVLTRKIADNLELFRVIFNVDPSALILLTSTFVIKELNWTAERLFGVYCEDCCNNESIERFIVPAAKKIFNERITAVLAGDIVRGFECDIKPVGHPERTVLWNAQRIVRASGIVEGILLVGNDITEQKALEKQRNEIENQLLHAQKMEAIGQLAGGVAHDFNNFLSAIMGNCDLILAETQMPDDLKQKVEQMLHCSERAAVLTRQLLTFSRKQVYAPKVLNINSILSEFVKMLHRLIGERIRLTIETDEKLDCIKSDQGRIEQILMNLAVNSRDAMPDGGTITIATSNVDLDERNADSHCVPFPGRYVMVAVADTGTGMDATIKERMFEPFFTTKEKGKGTGLGLATVYGIVKQNGGGIACDSTPGVGTTFRVYLPAEKDTAVADTVADTQDKQLSGTETVLVADDDPIIGNVISTILEHAGYTVLTAANGESAMRISDTYSETIHLLLTDMVMPGIMVKTMVCHLRSMRSELRVIYTSGYSDEFNDVCEYIGQITPFLQKPFNRQTLLRLVRDVLDNK